MKELHGLRSRMYLPLSRGYIGRVDVALLESRKPELDGSRSIAIRSTEDYVQPQMLVASTALVRLVVRCLHEQAKSSPESIYLPRLRGRPLNSASPLIALSEHSPSAS